MKNKISDKDAIIVNGIADHVTNSDKLKYTPFIITPDGAFYEVNGERVAQALFVAQHPTDLIPKVIRLQEAITGKRNW